MADIIKVYVDEVIEDLAYEIDVSALSSEVIVDLISNEERRPNYVRVETGARMRSARIYPRQRSIITQSGADSEFFKIPNVSDPDFEAEFKEILKDVLRGMMKKASG